MKRTIIIIICCMIYNTCFSTNCNDSLGKRSKEIIAAYKLVKENSDCNKCCVSYFNSFPSSWKVFKGIFGYEEDSSGNLLSTGPLYRESYSYINKFFECKEAVNDTVFFNKIVSIGLGGDWQADGVTDLLFGMYDVVPKKLKLVVNILSSYNYEEKFSFWYFYFSGPNVKNILQLKDYESINKDDFKILSRAYITATSDYKH